MVVDTFDLLVTAILYSIYGGIFIISLIFTFSLKTFLKIEELLDLELFSTPVLSPLEINIGGFDLWAKEYNTLVGGVLMMFSLLDMFFSYRFIQLITDII